MGAGWWSTSHTAAHAAASSPTSHYVTSDRDFTVPYHHAATKPAYLGACAQVAHLVVAASRDEHRLAHMLLKVPHLQPTAALQLLAVPLLEHEAEVEQGITHLAQG